jgi:enamine deaminase RidA (YjgF/YER057c/UK114 family)
MSSAEKRMKEMGLVLPEAIAPMGNYLTTLRVGDLIYTSGSGPFVNGKPLYQGRLGAEVTVEQGYKASRVTALNLLSLLKRELGDLDKIGRVVKVLGFVNSAADFYDQPAVINGASDFFVEVLGEKGKHTRSALGTSVLPFNIPVEIEMIVQVKED